MLHTDTLTEKYGPIHAVVLRHDSAASEPGADKIRETKLVDGNGIMRTYALVFLADQNNAPELAAIDREIKDGGMIGDTFRKHGYAATRKTIDAFIQEMPVWMASDFQIAGHEAAAKLIEFHAQKGTDVPVFYGTILEVYSPDFIDPKTFETSKEHLAAFHEKISDYFSRNLNR
jgi:hypothetical protein